MGKRNKRKTLSDSVLEDFPGFSSVLKERFGDNVYSKNSFVNGRKILYPIVVGGKEIGKLSKKFSNDFNTLFSKEAKIYFKGYGVINLHYDVQKDLREDTYEDIQFP